MTDIEKLLLELDKIQNYPNLMQEVRCGIRGLAFFPGGRGLFDNEDRSISNKEIMILGQDFDTLKKYQAAEKRGSEDITINKTWKKLSIILREAGIHLTNCFFTNSLMGVRQNGGASGPSPGFKDECFKKQCQDMFLFQLNLQGPKVIFVLGLQVARFLSPLADKLESWKRITTFRDVDNSIEGATIKNVLFKNAVTTTNVILLIHPSARTHNLNARQYKGLTGHAAQLKMIKDTLE